MGSLFKPIFDGEFLSFLFLFPDFDSLKILNVLSHRIDFKHASCFIRFLDASTHLYKRLCPSVGLSVGPSVGLSVGPSCSS